MSTPSDLLPGLLRLQDRKGQAQRIVKFYKELVEGGIPPVMAAELASREYQRPSSTSAGPFHVHINGDDETSAEKFAKRVTQAIDRASNGGT